MVPADSTAPVPPDTSSSAGPVDAGRDVDADPEHDSPFVRELVADMEAADELRRALIESGAADTPTLGAWRRARGVTGWCDEAKIAFAVAVVEEARRRVLLERLDGVCQFLAAGATPDQAMGRVVRLVDEFYGDGCCDCVEAAAA
jgi:hypothetical protein